MEIRAVLSAAAVGVLLLSCESWPQRSSLTGTKWEVVSLHGKPPIQTHEPLTAEFLPNDRLKGFGGVNMFEMGCEIRGNRVSPDKEMTTTLRGAKVPAIAEQESAFAKAIRGTRSYSLDDGDLLHLYGLDKSELVTLKRVPR